jgi:aminoglycoside phosphotransferase (APT) family kinase protein
MPSTVPAAAVHAAVSAAADLGIACTEPVVLNDGANVIVHLRPSPVVAKVAASTPAVRPDSAEWLQRELEVASYLAGAGADVMAPSAEVPATTHHADGHVMSFWTYLKPSGDARPDAATVGAMLRDLHAVVRSYPGDVPVLAPLRDIPAYLARPETQLGEGDAAILTSAFERLTAELTATSYTGQVLHGDAGAGNLMDAGQGRWVWHDFEDTCFGPVAWDLAPSAASWFLDGSQVLEAYGAGVDADQLAVCRELRLLHLTVWYSLYAERLPECRQTAAEYLALWRKG